MAIIQFTKVTCSILGWDGGLLLEFKSRVADSGQLQINHTSQLTLALQFTIMARQKSLFDFDVVKKRNVCAARYELSWGVFNVYFQDTTS